jgi:hypothetical protein
LASELAGRVRVAKLNVDENPTTAARFGLRSIPTLLVLSGGREVDRLVGVAEVRDRAPSGTRHDLTPLRPKQPQTARRPARRRFFS